MIFYLRIVVNTVGEQPDIEGNKCLCGLGTW